MDQDKLKKLAGSGGAFLAIGLVFFILGVSGQTAFMGVGIAFFVIGIGLVAQARKDGNGNGPAP